GSIGGGAGVFHAAGDEIIDHRLRVFLPRIIHAELFAEEVNHLGSARVVDVEAVAAILGCVVGDGDASPSILGFGEFACNDSEEIGGTELRFAPRPGLQTGARIGNADEFSIGDGEPAGRNGENRFRGETVIRVEISGQVVARVL